MAFRQDIIAGKAVVVVSLRDTLDRDFRSLRSKLRTMGNTLSSFGGEALRFGVGGILGSIIPVKDFIQFQDRLLFLQTKLQATDRQMIGLERRIRDLGKSTSFTSQQIADAATELAKAGFSIKEVEDALLPALDLARAGQVDLTTSTTILSNNLRTFGLDSSKAAELASKFITAARLGTLDIVNLNESLKESSGTFRTLGVNVEQALALITQLSLSSLKATKAGTSLNTAFINLARRAEDVGDLIGVPITDEDLRTPLALLTKLGAALSKMSKVEQVSVLNSLTNIRGARAITSILIQGLDRQKDLIDQITDSTNEARIAAEKLDSRLGGIWRRGLSAAQELSIAIGETTEGPLTRFGEALRLAFNDLSLLATANPEVVQTLLMIPPAAIAAGGAMILMGFAVNKLAFLMTGLIGINRIVLGSIATLLGAQKQALLGLFNPLTTRFNKFRVDSVKNAKAIATATTSLQRTEAVVGQRSARLAALNATKRAKEEAKLSRLQRERAKLSGRPGTESALARNERAILASQSRLAQPSLASKRDNQALLTAISKREAAANKLSKLESKRSILNKDLSLARIMQGLSSGVARLAAVISRLTFVFKKPSFNVPGYDRQASAITGSMFSNLPKLTPGALGNIFFGGKSRQPRLPFGTAQFRQPGLFGDDGPESYGLKGRGISLPNIMRNTSGGFVNKSAAKAQVAALVKELRNLKQYAKMPLGSVIDEALTATNLSQGAGETIKRELLQGVTRAKAAKPAAKQLGLDFGKEAKQQLSFNFEDALDTPAPTAFRRRPSFSRDTEGFKAADAVRKGTFFPKLAGGLKTTFSALSGGLSQVASILSKGIMSSLRWVMNTNWLAKIITGTKNVLGILKGVWSVLNGIRRVLFTLSGWLTIAELLFLFGDKIPVISDMLAYMGRAFSQAFKDISTTLQRTAPSLQVIGAGVRQLFSGNIIGGIETLKSGFRDLFAILSAGFAAGWERFKSNIEEFTSRLKALGTGLLNTFTALFEIIRSLIGLTTKNVGNLFGTNGGMANMLKGTFSANNISGFFDMIVAAIGALGEQLLKLVDVGFQTLNVLKQILAAMARFFANSWLTRDPYARAALEDLDPSTQRRNEIRSRLGDISGEKRALRAAIAMNPLPGGDVQKQMKATLDALKSEEARLQKELSSLPYVVDSFESNLDEMTKALRKAIEDIRNANNPNNSSNQQPNSPPEMMGPPAQRKVSAQVQAELEQARHRYETARQREAAFENQVGPHNMTPNEYTAQLIANRRAAKVAEQEYLAANATNNQATPNTGFGKMFRESFEGALKANTTIGRNNLFDPKALTGEPAEAFADFYKGLSNITKGEAGLAATDLMNSMTQGAISPHEIARAAGIHPEIQELYRSTLGAMSPETQASYFNQRRIQEAFGPLFEPLRDLRKLPEKLGVDRSQLKPAFGSDIESTMGNWAFNAGNLIGQAIAPMTQKIEAFTPVTSVGGSFASTRGNLMHMQDDTKKQTEYLSEIAENTDKIAKEGAVATFQ